MTLILENPVSLVPLIGPAFAHRLEKLEIKTVRGLLYHLPFRYEDYSLISKIKDLQEGETVTVSGTILEIKNEYARGGFVLQKAKIEDETGQLDILWFNQRFLTRVVHAGDILNFSGRAERQGKKLVMKSPEHEILNSPPGSHLQDHPLKTASIHTGRLVPVYPETAGITSKWLRSRINAVMREIKDKRLEIKDCLDEKTRAEENLMGLEEAIIKVHFPDSLEQTENARRRLAFDELLLAQLQSQTRKKDQQTQTVGNKLKIVEIRRKLTTFVENLSFTLTSAQKQALNDIYKDLAKPTPMNRLLQGDVGSGKTVVATLAMLATYLNGYQTVLMAPTEILAQQHYETINQLLSPLKIKIGIVTGAIKDFAGYDILVGTHALLSDKLKLGRLGLAVIDEQHRFGVEQRAKLFAKSANPHILTMTATPIPRTVALTLYGDLDMSVLDEMPIGRKIVKTWVVPPQKRRAAYEWIKKQQTQTFIICPLIEESAVETMKDVKAVKAEYETLSKEIFPDLKLGLLHGRLPAKEKKRVLNEFRLRKLDILVATPVVEVGIDIPAATIMVVEGADRFGLAQLHQLRGRVGRGEEQSYCLLFAEAGTDRLKYLEKFNSGMALAEADLKFRGPGERFGLAQHGRWDLKIADFSDLALIEKTNQLARQFLADSSSFPLLQEKLEKDTINYDPAAKTQTIDQTPRQTPGHSLRSNQ